MKWMRERDLLIAQTMAFVQSVTGRKPEAEVFARADIPQVTPTRLPDIEAMLAEVISPLTPPKPVASKPVVTEPIAAQAMPSGPVASESVPVELVAAEPVASAPVPPVRPATRSDYRSEIQARVEKFRAHQARINREREAYCSATMAKMQATLDNYPVRRK